MPWVSFNSTSSISSTNLKTLSKSIAQPIVYNGVEFNYDKLQSITSNASSDGKYVTYNRQYIGNSEAYSFGYYYKSSSRYWYVKGWGFPFLWYTENTKIPDYLYEVKITKIKGKFNTNKRTYDRLPILFQKGVTFPINVVFNNITYKYMTFASYNHWFNENENRTLGTDDYIGFYNTPATINQTPSDWKSVLINVTSNVMIDFGEYEQDIPEVIYNWIINNFDKVYENTYTIKSTTGETLTTLTEAPPMTSATLSAVGNAKYLTLTGENNNNYTMEWTSEAPQGKIFAGLATSKGGSIVIPVGETSTINLTDSTDLYEVWQTYRPPTTTFDINLYKNSAEPNKVDKTAELSTVGTISGALRQECSLINPEIIIQYDKPPDFNYCYIANFGRYYYVENIVSMRQNLWRVRLRCDVLMTYKTQILNLTARIARQQYTYSYRQIDSEIPFTNDPEITVKDIPNSVNLGKPHYENILLTVVGNGT